MKGADFQFDLSGTWNGHSWAMAIFAVPMTEKRLENDAPIVILLTV